MDKALAKATDTKIYELLHLLARNYHLLEDAKNPLRRAYNQEWDWQSQMWSGSWASIIESRANGNAANSEALWEKFDKIKATIAEINDEVRPLEALYNEHHWSRFYLVVGTGQGHIHENQSCHSCYDSTQYAWLTELSGESEAEAVQAEGEILCTFCYPSAPVAWCEGVGRRTQEAKDAATALKAERLAVKASKSLSLDGQPVSIRCDRETKHMHSWHREFKTYRAAEIWMKEALVWEQIRAMHPADKYIGYAPDAYSVANLEEVLCLMAIKKDVSVEEIREAFAVKVAKKLAEEIADLKTWMN